MTSYTPILSLPEVAPNQDQKETTINTALAILEAAMNDTLAVDMSAGNVVLNTDQFTKYFLLQVAPTAAHDLDIPATPRWFAVENQGTAAVTVKVNGSSGASVQLGAGKIGLMVSDGTDVRVVVPDPAAGTGILTDLSDVSGTPTDHQLLRWVAADNNWEPWTLTLAFSNLSDFPGSYASNASKLLAVKADGSGLEYVTSAANVHLFTDLTDAPTNYTGAANRTLKVNSAATGLIFAQPKLTEAIDFPSSYTSQATKYLRVNAGATAVEFHTPAVGDLGDGPGAPAVGNSLQYVRVKLDGSGLEYASGTGGPDHFYQLADVPSTYAGAAGKLVRVNGTADGLIFNTLKFTELSDVPANYTGAAGKFAQVNAGATALVFAQPKVSDLSDGPGVFTSNAKKVVRVNAGATALEYVSLAITDLAGFPSSLTGQGGKFLMVKVDESGLQFATSSFTTNFLALTDTPTSYTGHHNASVVVDPTGTGLVFGPIVPTRLGHLADVEDGTGTPTQGAFLRWIDGVWQADVFTPGGGGATSVAGLSDGPGAPTGHAGQLVRVNALATALEYFSLPMIPTRLGQLADVEDGTGTPAEGDILTWKDGVWQAEHPSAVTAGASALHDLTDVDEATAPIAGQMLGWNSSAQKWMPFQAVFPGSHPYWRIKIKAGESSTVALSEVAFKESAFGTTQDAPSVFAHNTATGSAAANAFDANSATSWTTNVVDTDTWLSVIYDTPTRVRSVNITSDATTAALGPASFDVEWSDTGSDWVLAWSVTASGWGISDSREFPFLVDSANEFDLPFIRLDQLADVSFSAPLASGQMLVWQPSIDTHFGKWVATDQPIPAFTNLNDAPGDYTGQAHKVVAVKADETGLEFIDAAVGGTGSSVTFLADLADVEAGTGTPAQGAFLRYIDGVWQADPYPDPNDRMSIDYAISKNGLLFNSQVLATIPITRNVWFADDFAGSRFKCKTNPSATTVISVMKNGTQIGSISIATTGVATFSTIATGEEALVDGDILRLDGPTAADATLADFGFTLKAQRLK